MALDDWVTNVRIPEECLAYRTFLTAQTALLIDTTAELAPETIGPILFPIHGEEGETLQDYTARIESVYDAGRADGSIPTHVSEYVVEDAYKTYCGVVPDDYAHDEEVIEEYNIAMTYIVWIDEMTK